MLIHNFSEELSPPRYPSYEATPSCKQLALLALMAHMRRPPLEIMVASEATATNASVLTSISVLLGILLQGRKKTSFFLVS